MAFLRLHPFFELFDSVQNAFLVHQQFADDGLEARTAAVVGIHSRNQLLAVFHQQSVHGFQVRHALGVCRLAVGLVGLALALETGTEFGGNGCAQGNVLEVHRFLALFKRGATVLFKILCPD